MLAKTENRLTKTTVEGAGRVAAWPIVFADTIGLYVPADVEATPRSAAVLFLSSWGFEEMCTRKFFRILAERMAVEGIASLRFDYPSTGDALDRDDVTLADWEASVLAAAGQLRALSGCRTLILVAEGLGSAIAERIKERLDGLAGIAHLAPSLVGRTYLRELAVWSKMVDEGLGLGEDQRMTEGVAIASHVMPPKIAEEVRRLNFAKPERTVAANYLVLERPVRVADTGLADALRAAGADVRFGSFEGYDDLVANPTIQQMPMEAVETVISWLRDVDPEAEPTARPDSMPESGTLQGEAFTEIPVRFGVGDRLYGIICMPKERRVDSAVLITNTGYDRNAGWGRTSLRTARNLAALGIPSFRFDTANVADSPPVPGAPRQVLYSDWQNDDVRAALDLMAERIGGRVAVLGRCSGAYLALRSGYLDPRIGAIVSVNPYVFYWDPAVPVGGKLQFVPRSLDDYGQRLARLDTFRRILRGEVDIPAAARNILIALGKRLARRYVGITRHLPANRHVHAEVRRMFDAYAERRMPVRLVYSEADVGLDDLHLHFGPHNKGLRAYPNVELTMLPDTDHNVTPEASRKIVFEKIVEVAKKIG